MSMRHTLRNPLYRVEYSHAQERQAKHHAQRTRTQTYIDMKTMVYQYFIGDTFTGLEKPMPKDVVMERNRRHIQDFVAGRTPRLREWRPKK